MADESKIEKLDAEQGEERVGADEQAELSHDPRKQAQAAGQSDRENPQSPPDAA